jgi:hypothetical protein
MHNMWPTRFDSINQIFSLVPFKLQMAYPKQQFQIPLLTNLQECG